VIVGRREWFADYGYGGVVCWVESWEVEGSLIMRRMMN
jgi:hypothetical protein